MHLSRGLPTVVDRRLERAVDCVDDSARKFGSKVFEGGRVGGSDGIEELVVVVAVEGRLACEGVKEHGAEGPEVCAVIDL